MNTNTGDGAQPRFFETVVYGGLAIGVLDMLDAFTFFGWYLGLGAQKVFQGVAAGVLGGEAAAAGGWNTFALGLFLHFVTAFCVATVYYLLSRNLTLLIRHPVAAGLIYGVVVNYVMQYVVIPFSAIGRWPTFSLRSTLNNVIGHALLIGLPVALIASWSARRNVDSDTL